MGLFDLRKDMSIVKEDISKPFDGLSSGISSLDNLILGFGKGEMITIAGRPGMGKSSLARDILLNIGKPNAGFGVSLLCTLEMSCPEVAELLVTNLAKVDYSSLKKGYSTTKLLAHLDIVCEQLSSYNIIINDDSYVTPDSIREILITIGKEEPLACLVVDYLQLMSLRKKVESRQTEVAEISRELKAIAREFNIPVISFAQLNRNVEHRENSRPRMADLRGSGAMENDSTKIILIHRPSYYDQQLDSNAEDTGEAELIVCKNRSGKIGTVECAWISDFMSFQDRPDIEEF